MEAALTLIRECLILAMATTHTPDSIPSRCYISLKATIAMLPHTKRVLGSNPRAVPQPLVCGANMGFPVVFLFNVPAIALDEGSVL